MSYLSAWLTGLEDLPRHKCQLALLWDKLLSYYRQILNGHSRDSSKFDYLHYFLQVKWKLKVSQRDFFKEQPTCFLQMLHIWQISVHGKILRALNCQTRECASVQIFSFFRKKYFAYSLHIRITGNSVIV